jgi:hypothetical protein
MRPARQLLAELQPAVRDREIGVALRYLAAILCPDRLAYPQGSCRVRVAGLQLDVSPRSLQVDTTVASMIRNRSLRR